MAKLLEEIAERIELRNKAVMKYGYRKNLYGIRDLIDTYYTTENKNIMEVKAMLKTLVQTNKLYGYITDYYCGGKGIVLAYSEEHAKRKVKDAYLKHGYSESELSELEVWAIETEPFEDALDVLEIWN